jgi:hypothetical protein
MRTVTIHALRAVVERHKLEPVNGEYHFTDEMLAEAAAIDEAWGDRMPPEELKDLKAALEGKPNSGDWEEVLDDIAEEQSRNRTRSHEATTDDAYDDFIVKLRRLLVEERPPHELALRAATHMAVGLAVPELGMDAPTAKAWFSKAIEEFVDKLEAHGRKY